MTSRLLVGGWVGQPLFIDSLANADVTHIVNMRHEHVGDMVKKQFSVLECEEGEVNDFLPASFWCRVFSFTAKAYRGNHSKIYFHVPARQHPESPVGCYAGLRSLGYSALQARIKLERAHPIMMWHETAMKGVETAFDVWCKQTGKNPELVRRALSERVKALAEKNNAVKPFGFAEHVASRTNAAV